MENISVNSFALTPVQAERAPCLLTSIAGGVHLLWTDEKLPVQRGIKQSKENIYRDSVTAVSRKVFHGLKSNLKLRKQEQRQEMKIKIYEREDYEAGKNLFHVIVIVSLKYVRMAVD